jgi:hypothetical protein
VAVRSERPLRGGPLESPVVFTVAERDALQERVLQLAKDDRRVVGGAIVGSLALGGGDRFSDLDLTFGIHDKTPVVRVLDDWTETVRNELQGVALVDLERGSTIYRVFVLPHALQLDLSMTPAADFRPGGPRFRLLFGDVATPRAQAAGPSGAASIFIATPPDAANLFGWGVIYALHTRACIERGRLWQAEHYVGAVRDHGLSLACLREGKTVVQARGYDDLSPNTHARFEGTHPGSLETDTLRAALTASLRALLLEASDARLANAESVAARLDGLR